jgi:short-subunit dehydrogenase
MAGYPFTRALVTGASSGIGEEITRQLAAAGIPVVVVARRKDRLEALAKELPGIEVLVADLVTKEGVAAVVQRVASDTNPIDLVVNNAGFGSQTLLATHDPQRMADELTLNCTSLSLISRAAAATMAPRGRGFILNVSSIAAFNPSAFMAVYSATKAYVLSLSQAMNVELKGAGVHA